ncbi:MAG: peptidase M16 [SAR116 cluster bacterium]|nr:peptidase M16 [SAR116 cluster bacterium]
MAISLTKLKSDITILSDQFKSKTLSLGLWLDVGSVSEKDNQVGIAHMLEHMAFKGTKSRNAYQIAREIEDIGGDINAYTGKERTAYYVRLLPENLDLGIDILSDILINSIFPRDEIERERGVIISEIGQSNDSPDDKVYENFVSTSFNGQSLGNSILGTEKTVNSFKQNDLVKFCDEFYNTSNLIIGVCGDFDKENFIQQVNEKFINFRLGLKTKKPIYRWCSGNFIEERDLEQSNIIFGLEGLCSSDKERYALRALTIIYGYGMSSKLFQEIREKRGLCYSIYGFCSQYSSSGTFGFSSGCSPENLEQLLECSIRELIKLRGNIREDDLKRAKLQLKSGLLMSQESSMSRLEQNVSSILTFNKIMTIDETIKNIEELNISKIENVLDKILQNIKPVLSIVGPNSSILNKIDLKSYF